MKRLIFIGIFAALAWLLFDGQLQGVAKYLPFNDQPTQHTSQKAAPQSTGKVFTDIRPPGSLSPQANPGANAPSTSSSYRCDGRIYCSQMSSCAEATWFLQNCPGTKMDGNNDGIPCEKQWCR
jgi:hypothetical protein